MLLKIDKEFKDLIPPLTFHERTILEDNIKRDGCRDPIVVWSNCNDCPDDIHKDDIDHQCHNAIILDGHNRYDICNSNGIKYQTSRIILNSRFEAINWIIDNQLGKRNVTPEIKDYLIGKRYQMEKKSGDSKGNQYTIENSAIGQNELKQNTAKVIADLNKVSESSVKRDEKFSEAIDTIAASSGKSAMDILNMPKISKEDAKKASSLPTEVQKEIVDKVISGETKSFKEALRSVPDPEPEKNTNPFDEFEPGEIVFEKSENDYHDEHHCTIFVPLKSDIKMCPCGDHGYCEVNEKWYSKEEINKLKE